MIRRFLALCLFVTSGAGLAQAPAPVPSNDTSPPQGPVTTLKVATRVVEISAVVKAKTGEPVGGLTRDDFLLKQDGKEEPVRYFSQADELPLSFALLVDTSGSQRTFIGDESLASDVFFETMLTRKDDRAMLVQFDTAVVQLRGMTNSVSALHLALNGLASHPATNGGTLLYDAIETVAKSILAHETGRKAIVILSDGGDNGSRRTLAEAVEQAQRADIPIYSVLYSLWGNFQSLGGPHPAYGPVGATGLPAGDVGLSTLQKLSDSTGGRVFRVSPGNGLREIFAQIGQELRLQYELGYTPPQDTQPNSYHKLELKVKDKKLTVQARKGFFAQP